jgi:hypothetical protein
MTSRNQHPAELRERAVAMVFELRAASGSSRGTLASVGQKLGGAEADAQAVESVA